MTSLNYIHRGNKCTRIWEIRLEQREAQRKSRLIRYNIFLQLNSIHPFWNSKPANWLVGENVKIGLGSSRQTIRERRGTRRGLAERGYQLPQLLSRISFFCVNDTCWRRQTFRLPSSYVHSRIQQMLRLLMAWNLISIDCYFCKILQLIFEWKCANESWTHGPKDCSMNDQT